MEYFEISETETDFGQGHSNFFEKRGIQSSDRNEGVKYEKGMESPNPNYNEEIMVIFMTNIWKSK